MSVRMQAKKSPPNTMVANLMEANPDPGSAASVKKAPSMDINAKIRIHPNIDWFLRGNLCLARRGAQKEELLPGHSVGEKFKSWSNYTLY